MRHAGPGCRITPNAPGPAPAPLLPQKVIGVGVRRVRVLLQHFPAEWLVFHSGRLPCDGGRTRHLAS